MIEIRRLTPRKWEPSDPLVAYNNADGQVVIAGAMGRGNNSYYDRYGYKGSKEIVCIDCKEAGREVPVQLVDAKTRCKHFRHQAGEAPDGLRRYGETAEHLHGKRFIMDWARDQHHILPWSVEDEVWIPGVRLRSDVRATAASGRHLAFEVQRKPMDSKEWDHRHGGYQTAGIRDVWLWSPDVPDVVLDLPLTSVVLDMAYESLGVLVAKDSGRYRHPTAERYILSPTHYASAPLSEWSLSDAGSLVPPPGMAEFIGTSRNRPGWHNSTPIMRRWHGGHQTAGDAGGTADGRTQAVPEPHQLQSGTGSQRKCAAYRPGTGGAT
ncbi:competence protein CoiA family protein [Arthrobacter sp. NPDC093128]|uniref:competence protein CoiA family protein n=1 Tax=Arthrobacter sp. NPDC093128 TaxID=3154979 RepID=UPI00343F0ADE